MAVLTDRPASIDWSLLDIVWAFVLSALFGVLLGFASLGLLGIQALGTIPGYTTNLIWMLPGFFVVYVLRRPGAALLMALVAGQIAVVVTPAGSDLLFSLLIRSFCIELAVAVVTQYRRFVLRRWTLAALLTGGLLIIVYLWLYEVVWLDQNTQLLACATITLSVVASAALAKLLADLMVRTGLLPRTAASEAQF